MKIHTYVIHTDPDRPLKDLIKQDLGDVEYQLAPSPRDKVTFGEHHFEVRLVHYEGFTPAGVYVVEVRR